MGHRQVEVGRFQLGDGPPGPVGEDIENSAAQLDRLENAAVEQDRRGEHHRPARVQRAGLLTQEPRQVAGDRRIGGVRQADLGQANSPPS